MTSNKKVLEIWQFSIKKPLEYDTQMLLVRVFLLLQLGWSAKLSIKLKILKRLRSINLNVFEVTPTNYTASLE